MTNSSTLEQIAEVKRELALRVRVYPKWIAAGNMTQAQADKQIAVMTDILARLEAAQARVTPSPTAEG